MNRSRHLFCIALGLGLFLVATYALLIFLSRTTLTVDGKTLTHYSLQKGTVQELLNLFSVTLSSQDFVQPALADKIRWGERVQVVRVREELEEKKEEIDFILDWKRRTAKNLRKVEIQKGYKKKIRWTLRHIFHDGKKVETKASAKKIQKIPVERLVLFTKKGYPEKIYDLSRVKKIRMIATAYWEGDPQVPGVFTYLDQRIQPGLVAVDPKVIPLRSRLYIPGYGYAYASDTGSAIKGKRIDLVVPNKEASKEWEHKKVDVYILERAKTW